MTSTLETDPQTLEHGISNSKLEVFELSYEKWHLVEEAFISMGSPLPDPTRSAIMVAVEEGKILGFITLQSKLHAEPMFVYPEGQHKQIPEFLYSKLDSILPVGMDYLVTVENEALGRRAEAAGFISLGKAYGKVIRDELL